MRYGHAEVTNANAEVTNANAEVTNANAEVANANAEVTNANAEVANANAEVTNDINKTYALKPETLIPPSPRQSLHLGKPLQPFGHPAAGASLSRVGEDRAGSPKKGGNF